MPNVTTAKQFLSLLGESINEPALALNEEQVCSFNYDEKLEVNILVPPGYSVIHFLSVIGELPLEKLGEACQWLLKKNFLMLDTEGASLAIDEAARYAVLSQVKPLEGMSPEELMDNFSIFLTASERLAEEYRDEQQKSFEVAQSGSALQSQYRV